MWRPMGNCPVPPPLNSARQSDRQSGTSSRRFACRVLRGHHPVQSGVLLARETVKMAGEIAAIMTLTDAKVTVQCLHAPDAVSSPVNRPIINSEDIAVLITLASRQHIWVTRNHDRTITLPRLSAPPVEIIADICTMAMI